MPLSAKATQEFVPIKEIRDGVVILKDGELRAVVLCNSVNLSLKSADEQKAIIYQFQNFINTLDFSVQISVQSRRLDIRPYLLLLENRMKMQGEPLLKLQTAEYMQFIREFTETVSIMTKNFFVVVPYAESALKTQSGFLSKIFRRGESIAKEATDFAEKRTQLEQRVAVVQQGLSSCSIKSVHLGTEEIVEMFYKVFNPGEADGKIDNEPES